MTKEKQRKSMQAVKSKDSKIEIRLRKALWDTWFKIQKELFKTHRKPDIVLVYQRIAIFCYSEFWLGYNWEERKNDININREF